MADCVKKWYVLRTAGGTEKKAKEYLEKYCKKHGYSKEEAEKHVLVKNVKQYYEDSRK